MGKPEVIQARETLRHIPELDGVRGLAILAVLALHFVCNGLQPSNAIESALAKVTSYGVWGVDLFFVLSGFLITGILYDAKGGKHYFRNFYVRRTLRIFPLYYLAVLLMAVVVPLTGLTKYMPGAAQLPGLQFWLWSYLTNVYLAGEQTFSIPYVAHFWTLAIEEHFYLVWPLVIAFSARRTAMLVSVLAGTGALLLRLWLAQTMPQALASQVLTPCRVDSLCAGAWFALAARGDGGMAALGTRARRYLIWSLAGVLLASSWHRLSGGVYSSVVLELRTTLLAVLFGASITLSAWTEGPASMKRLLRNHWLSYLGRYSYGLYVYHGIIAYAWHDNHLFTSATSTLGSHLAGVLVMAGVGLTLSLLVSVLSYELFERRLLALKKRFESEKRPVTEPSVLATPPPTAPPEKLA